MTNRPSPLWPAGPQRAPSLVPPKSITHEFSEATECENTSWVKGDCTDHGTTVWIRVPCKRRFCPYCGYIRRAKIAARIDNGIYILAGQKGAGYIECNWGRDPPKKEAVRKVTRLVAWVRRHQRARPEYALTWEQTRKHVLHVNLLFAPWRYMAQADLSFAWQRLTGWPIVWVERVGVDIAQEMAKGSRTPGWYFAKHEQMVATGRTCAFSKHWPQLPAHQHWPRKGHITWTPPWALQAEMLTIPQFQIELQTGWWDQLKPGWYIDLRQTQCDCYSLIKPTAA